MQSIENKNVPSKKISPRCDADAPDFTLIPVYLLIHAGIYSGRTTDDELAEKKSDLSPTVITKIGISF